MMGMAKSNKITTGTIKPVNNEVITIPFGKTLTDYIILFEMTDESFSNFKNAGLTSGIKGIAFICKYKFCGTSPSNHTLQSRYNFATGNTDGAASQYPSLYNDRIELNSRDITNASALVLYNGYEYNYMIIELE